MKPLRLASDVSAVASRVIWFEPPEMALTDPIRFVTWPMAYGTAGDIAVARRCLDLDDFHMALENAPPGIRDEQSWARWNALAGRDPPLPMPRHVIPG